MKHGSGGRRVTWAIQGSQHLCHSCTSPLNGTVLCWLGLLGPPEPPAFAEVHGKRIAANGQSTEQRALPFLSAGA